MTAERCAQVRDVVALAAAYLFMLGIGWSNGAIYLGIVALILATLADWPRFRVWASRSPLFWAVVALSLYLLLRDQWSGPFPVPGSERADELKDLLDIAGIPTMAVGWWFARYPGHMAWLMLVAALGLVIGVALHIDWANLGEYLALQQRLAVHLGGNGPSTFGGALMLGTMVYGWSTFRHEPGCGTRDLLRAAPIVLLWLFGLGLLLAGQTRSAWIAIVGTGVVVVLLWAWRHRGGSLSWLLSRHWMAGLVMAVVVVLVVVAVWEPIVQRLTREQETWRSLAALDLEGVEQHSIGLRVTAWRIGLEAYLDHPWLGTGIGSTPHVLEQSDIHIGKILGHFHSLYLHLLYTTGLLGFLLACGVVVGFCREAIRGMSLDPECTLMARFAGVSALFFGIASLAIIRYDDPHGMAYMILIGACAVAPGMRRSLVEREGRSGRGPGDRGGTRSPGALNSPDSRAHPDA